VDDKDCRVPFAFTGKIATVAQKDENKLMEAMRGKKASE
jgi:hypothetical protein